MDSTAEERPTTSSFPGSFTHRSGAKALVTSGQRVLLVKERHADGSAFWTLPGGGVERHECPREGLKRELVEELHCRSRVGDQVSTFWYAHQSCEATVTRYKIYDCALLATPTPNRTEGIHDARWVDPADSPTGTLPQVRGVCRLHVADD
jgi:ADP-ribose pyrophosphatase YjhB (NUDIX family)